MKPEVERGELHPRSTSSKRPGDSDELLSISDDTQERLRIKEASAGARPPSEQPHAWDYFPLVGT